MTGPWLLGVEQIHKGSVLIDDAVPLPCAGGTGLGSPMGRGVSVLHLVLVPSEELVLPLDDELAGHLF
jgi:hypothetical protein